ncbi:MAG: transposase [Solirubrobacteraceae bacterium]
MTVIDAAVLIDRFCSRAARSRLRPFVRLAKTIRKHAQGILAAISTGINQARVEALNNKARLSRPGFDGDFQTRISVLMGGSTRHGTSEEVPRRTDRQRRPAGA